MKTGYLAALMLAIGVTHSGAAASAIGGGVSAHAGPAVPQGVWQGRSDMSAQIQSKIVILSKRRRGDEMEVRYRIEFTNVPAEKRYRMFMLTGFMQKEGLPEVDLSETFEVVNPAREQRISMEFGVILYKGEWIRMRLRSLDGTVEKAVRFTLFK